MKDHVIMLSFSLAPTQTLRTHVTLSADVDDLYMSPWWKALNRPHVRQCLSSIFFNTLLMPWLIRPLAQTWLCECGHVVFVCTGLNTLAWLILLLALWLSRGERSPNCRPLFEKSPSSSYFTLNSIVSITDPQ